MSKSEGAEMRAEEPAAVDEERLVELADRCEAATGPDRELDAAICDWLRDNSGFVPNRADIAYPFYAFTASLDAALTLVPEGWSVGIHQQDSGWVVELRKGYNTSYSTVVFSETRPGKRAATPALALCAAALRSLSTPSMKE